MSGLKFLVLACLCLFACEDDKPDPGKDPAPTLTYTTQNIAFSSLTGGVTKEVAGSMILNGVTGKKDGYTIKEITLVSTTASATLSGDKFTLTKVGNIVFNLVLKHSSKQDASIKNCTIVIDKGAAASLTFNKRTKAFVSGGSFSTSEILAGVQGSKTGYTLKSIASLTPSGIASVRGTKPNFALNFTKAGTFTATIVLEHPTKADVTITGAQFEIGKASAASLTFNKRTKTFASGGSFSTSEILAGVQGSKTGYTLKSIASLTPSGIASVSGTKPNFVLNFTKAGMFTATLVLEHPTKTDVTITAAQFEIGKASAASLTFNKVTKTFASGGSFSTSEILAGVQGSKTGYTLKSIASLTPSGIASVSGTKPNLALNFTKAGTFTATLVLEHASKADVTITGAQFEIGKASAPSLTFNKRTKAFASGGSFTTADILAGVQGTKTGYTLKSIASLSPSDVASVRGTKPNLALNFTKAGTFTATIVLEHASKADVTLTTAQFVIATPNWDKTFGGSDNDEAKSIVQTSDGGYVIAGMTRSNGAGNYDMWLVKTDANGNKQWDKTFGGSQFDEFTAVIETSDGYVLVGNNSSRGSGKQDGYLLKTDKTGNKTWEKSFGGSDDDSINDIIQTNEGGYMIIGFTKSGSDYNGWVVKTNAQGTEVWNKKYGGSKEDLFSSIIKTSDGGYALTGTTKSKTVSFTGAVWLVKIDGNGNKTLDKHFGGSEADKGLSLVQSSDGGYVIAGSHLNTSYNFDMWLVKTDASGNMSWDKKFGNSGGADSGKEICYDIIKTNDGYVLAGITSSKGSGKDDFWLVKTDTNGNKQWDKTFGGANNDQARSVIQTSDGGYVLAGYTESKGAGKKDCWIVRYRRE